jgi:hypothetical protein
LVEDENGTGNSERLGRNENYFASRPYDIKKAER